MKLDPETREQVEAEAKAGAKTIRTRKPPVPLEREVMKQVKAALELLGLADHVHRRNTGAMRNASGRLVRFGRPGDSDWSGILPGPGPGIVGSGGGGRALSLEVKRPGKKPTPAQLAHLAAVNAAGGVGVWIDDGAKAYGILKSLMEGASIEVDAKGVQWVVWPGADRAGGEGRS